MKNETYKVTIEKQEFIFSAAHFLTYENGFRESIHGHNFKVKVDIGSGKLVNSMVIDFLELDKTIIDIINPLKDKIIIAKDDSSLNIKIDEKQVNITHSDAYLSLPKSDCAILPIKNSSTEYLANYIGSNLFKKLDSGFKFVEVFVEEAVGCQASYKIGE